MKKFSKYIFTLAALALASTACVKEAEYEKGPQDVEGCYGVYFPAQETTGDHTYDPSQSTDVEFTVVRTNPDGDITVPVKYTESHAGIFQLGELSFVDGEVETTLKVTFPESETGVKYKLSLSIDDPQYASRYSEGATNIDFSVMRVEWKWFLNPQTKQPANFTFTQKWWDEVHTGKVKYYEVNGVYTCQTVTDPYQYSDGVGYGFWGTADAEGEGELTFTWYSGCKLDEEETQEAVCVDPSFVYTDPDAGDIYLFDYYHYWTVFNPQAALQGVDFQTFAKKYNSTYPVSYYQNGTFSMYVHLYASPETGLGAKADTYDVILEAEGFIRTDYSLALKAGQSNKGQLPVQFTPGADVAKVKYAVFEGELYAAQVTKNAAAIADGSVESVEVTAEQLAANNILNVTLDETGVYTLVAVTYDAEGAAQKSASVSFGYVAAEDKVPVVVSAGIGSADKYVPAGVNTDNALECWVYGKDLKSVQMGVFSAQDLSKGMPACLAQVLASKPVSAEILEEINGEGYVTVVDKLNPGTQYHLLVVASNGFETKPVISEGVYTTGDPHPVYMSFTVADLKDELMPESSEGYFGTYNYYAKTLDESGEKLTSSRDYLGQIVLSDSDYPDSEPDEDGIKSEYVTVNGLVPFAETLGLKENTTFEYYDGLLYTGTAGGSYGQDTKFGLYTYMYHMDATTGKYYNANLVGGFVEDGYLAFVNLYASQGLNITALALVAFGDAELTDYQGEFDIFNDILLVKPEKDDSGLAPKPETSSFKLNLVRKALAKGPTNLVETPSGNFRTIVDQVRNLPNVCGQFTGIQGERDAKAVSFSSEFSSEKVQKFSKNDPYTKVANISLR